MSFESLAERITHNDVEAELQIRYYTAVVNGIEKSVAHITIYRGGETWHYQWQTSHASATRQMVLDNAKRMALPFMRQLLE